MPKDERAMDERAIDRHIGMMVRWRRQELRMGQKELADRLDISYQQLQKCEKGLNRIGAGRLTKIAEILEVRICYFFTNVPQTGDVLSPGCDRILADAGASVIGEMADHQVQELTSASELSMQGIELIRHFSQIEDQKVRGDLINLVKNLEANDDDGDEEADDEY